MSVAPRERTRSELRVIAHAPRPATLALVRSVVPRRTARVVVTRTVGALERAMRAALVDAVIVDLDASAGEPLRGASLAREFPRIAFIGMSAWRPLDAGAIARCAELDFADVLADDVDGALLQPALTRHGFTPRFAAALATPPATLGLGSALQVAAWRRIVERGGRTVRTQELAGALAVTREHLSRSFAAGGAPTLKRAIDLVRLLAAAELAKNPGYGVGDVARLLGYASSSHLSTCAQRLVGAPASALAALRAVDVIGRFTHNHSGSVGR